MAIFLTTRGLSNEIEQVITDSKDELFILTPYLKFPLSLYDRLKHMSSKRIVSFVYGKEGLKKDEEKRLYELNCNIYFKENLHAKCYANSERAIVCSMNFHSFSEMNNEEMGVLLDKVNDREAYTKCIENIKFIIESSDKKRIISSSQKEMNQVNTILPKQFKTSWHERLIQTYPSVNFEMRANNIFAKNFRDKKFIFSDEYGFATIKIESDFESCKRIREKYFYQLEHSLNRYRIYWKSPFNKSCLYSSDKIEFKTVEEEIRYCVDGLQILIANLINFK